MTFEVRVRNVSRSTVNVIDNNAKKKNLSREEYLRQLLDTHASAEIVQYEVNRYSELVDKMLLVIESNTKILNEILPLLDDLNYGKTKENFN